MCPLQTPLSQAPNPDLGCLDRTDLSALNYDADFFGRARPGVPRSGPREPESDPLGPGEGLGLWFAPDRPLPANAGMGGGVLGSGLG